ncbi:MAG TPA: amidase [Clostridia bacterium]|nr:amidase [Clostridia bacterium]
MKNEKGAVPVADSRRTFLKASVAGAAGAVVFPELLSAQTAQRTTPGSFELDEISLHDLRKGLDSGKYTARALAQKYLARIDAIDRHGPSLNSVIEVNPDALAIADRCDQERRADKVRGPLHGIPILIKDNIASADKMQTTAGSLALQGSKPPKDAFVVARLREAGAVILGKTNCSEWANFRSTRSTSGWSGRGGQTRNPYVLDRNPSGSSSGSAVAVSANLCALAVGTETDGSIVSPACSNGIVGIKPTVGLLSRSGIIPISHTQDTAGPMTRTVADAAALLSILAAVDPADNATEAARARIEQDYTRFLDPSGLRGARIGVVRKYAGYSIPLDLVFEEAITAMKRAGAEIIDPADVPTIGKFDDAELEVMLYEFKAGLNAYFATLGSNSPVHTLKELIDFNEKNRERELRYFGQEMLALAEAKGPLTTPDYLKSLADCRRLSRQEGIDAVMDKHRLDALVAPTGNAAWPTDLVNGDHFTGSSTSLAAVAGYPNINVPMGFIFGLPIGVSFFGRAWSEPVLIKVAYAYEQSTKMRKAPTYLPTLNLG